tara:strand:+ start:768 stop:1070 length:303 start_codon:yes stop_codon:yes gene_type:complete
MNEKELELNFGSEYESGIDYNTSQITDYTEDVTVTLTRSDWNWFVTLMTDSVNKMEQAVSAAGLDAEGFLAIDTLRTIRNEIARQSGLDQFIEGDASESP